MNTKYKEDACAVCFEKFDTYFIPLSPCGHYIHKECVIKSGKKECPICRKNVYIPTKEEEEPIINVICVIIFYVLFSYFFKHQPDNDEDLLTSIILRILYKL